MTNNSDYQNRIVELAKDILLLSRNSLLVNLRFLDVALSQFELIPQSEDAFLTDGKNLLYNPKLVLNVPDYQNIFWSGIFCKGGLSEKLWRCVYSGPSGK